MTKDQLTLRGVGDLAGALPDHSAIPSRKAVMGQFDCYKALGRSRTPKAGTGALTVDGLPFFLQAEQLKPFISEELRLSTTPIFFKGKDGRNNQTDPLPLGL